MSIPEVYRGQGSMEPLMPKGGDPRLAELTCEILKASGCLTAHVHAPRVLEALAAIVREMNCYYSNLIEGHKTTPRDIERAMGKDFSKDPTQRDNQLLGLAHIEVEKLLHVLPGGHARPDPVHERALGTPRPAHPCRAVFPI